MPQPMSGWGPSPCCWSSMDSSGSGPRSSGCGSRWGRGVVSGVVLPLIALRIRAPALPVHRGPAQELLLFQAGGAGDIASEQRASRLNGRSLPAPMRRAEPPTSSLCPSRAAFSSATRVRGKRMQSLVRRDSCNCCALPCSGRSQPFCDPATWMLWIAMSARRARMPWPAAPATGRGHDRPRWSGIAARTARRRHRRGRGVRSCLRLLARTS
jgi:hypothetical protein